MGINPQLVETIVQRILTVSRPQRIILFGSAAHGSMTANSDIDLLVLEPSTDNPRQESVRIAEALRGLKRPFDVLVMHIDRFEESKDVVGGIAYPAHKYGRVIYEAA